MKWILAFFVWGSPSLSLAGQKTDFLLPFLSQDAQAFEHANLVYHSGSLQHGAMADPRVILPSKTLQTVMTFHDGPKIEIIRFNPEAKSRHVASRFFQFSEASATTLGRMVEKDRTYVCAQCHYSPLRPIWSDYDRWEGVYGSVDDAILEDTSNEDLLRGLSVNGSYKNIPELIALQKKEWQGLQAFKTKWTQHGEPSPYQLLPFLHTVGSVAPFSPRSRYRDYKRRPNVRTTKILSNWNAEKIHGMLQEKGEAFEALVPAFLFASFSCRPTPSFQALRQKLVDSHPFKEAYLDGAFGLWFERAANAKFYKDLVLILSFLGLEKEDWSLEKNPRAWSYFVGNPYMLDLVRDKILDESNGSSHFRSTLADLNYSEKCQTLDKHLPEDLPATPEPPKADIRLVCASCHQGGKQLDLKRNPFYVKRVSQGLPVPQPPKIPFLNQEKFQQESGIWVPMIEKTIRDKSMPPNRSLLIRERKALLEFLEENH